MNNITEQLGTLKSIIETLLILNNLNRQELIPTQLELLYLEVTQLVEEFCVVRNETKRE